MRRPLFLLLSLFLPAAAAGQAQTLPLKREVPPPRWEGCPAAASLPVTPAARRDEAQRIAAQATQAALLGDPRAALEHLERALQLDPASPDLTYRMAVALEQVERPRDAAAAFCRYLAVSPGAADAGEVRDRINSLIAAAGAGVSAGAAAAFREGLAHFDADSLDRAEAAFGRAWEADPSWGAPLFNRGVVRLAAGRTGAAAEDLRRYLELSPAAPDLNPVLGVLLALRESPAPPVATPAVELPYNPALTLASGLLVPGLGHFTTGRSRTGMIVAGGALAALAAGLAVQRTEVDCLAPTVDGRCPDDQVLDRRTERPYVGAGIAAAVGIGVLGALDAWRGARARNAAAAARPSAGAALPGRVGGASLLAPAVTASADGALGMALLRIRF